MKNFGVALTNIRRSPYQSMAAVMLVTITLFVAYVASLFMMGAEFILRYFETRPQIIAFFEIDAQSDSLEKAKSTMELKPYVEEVKLVTKEQALDIYQETNQADPLLLELVTADILPASIEVSGIDVDSLSQIKDDLSQLKDVDEVIYQQNVVEMLRNWTTSMRVIGIAGIVLLSATSFLTIMVITGLKIRNKRYSVNIMRIIGASGWYVKAPYFYEGFMYGLLGSILGWGSMYTLLLYSTPWLKSFLGTVPILPVPPEILLIQLGVGTVIAVSLTSFASLTAVSKIIKN